MSDAKKWGSVADIAPTGDQLTDYDRAHLKIYLMLLDGDAAKVDPVVMTRDILGIDPGLEPDRARRAYNSHLARARWMTAVGYALLASEGSPPPKTNQ